MNGDFEEMHLEQLGDPAGTDHRRPTRRQRVVVGVVAAMLVAAAGGIGYGLGRNFDDVAGDDAAGEDVSADPGAVEGAEPTPTETDAAVPTSVSEGPSDDSTASASSGSATPGVAEDAAVADIARASGGYGYSQFGSMPMELLYESTTVSGLTLRAQLGPTWDPAESDWGAGEWRPAPWCYESGQIRVAVAGNGMVDVGGVPWFREPFKGRAVSWVALGGADSQPHWVIVVQTPADTTNVAVTMVDGATDVATPQNGIAVLAFPGVATVPSPDGGPYPVEQPPVFDVSFEGGAEPSTFSSTGAGNWDDPEFQASCSPPPPALPDAGEQPVDPATAEADIVSVMTRLYDATVDREPGLVDDDTGVVEARAQVAEGGFASEADSAQAVIEELVFTSPTEAWFRYRIETDGVNLPNRYGIARFIDGTWRITRDTVCQDLSMAGGDCGGDWQPVFPPRSGPDVVAVDPIEISD